MAMLSSSVPTPPSSDDFYNTTSSSSSKTHPGVDELSVPSIISCPVVVSGNSDCDSSTVVSSSSSSSSCFTEQQQQKKKPFLHTGYLNDDDDEAVDDDVNKEQIKDGESSLVSSLSSSSLSAKTTPTTTTTSPRQPDPERSSSFGGKNSALPRRSSSILKKTSSYTSLENDGIDSSRPELFIRNKRSSWKALPPLKNIPSTSKPKQRHKHYKLDYRSMYDVFPNDESNTTRTTVASSDDNGDDDEYQRHPTEKQEQQPRPSTDNIRRSSSCVSFGTVDVRDYEQTLGDNPSVSYGAPISLDWNYTEYEPVDFDRYELQFSKNEQQRRTPKQMVMSHYRRKHLLMDVYGFSKGEYDKAKRDANKIKLKRGLTNYFNSIGVESAVQESIGGLRKILLSGGSK